VKFSDIGGCEKAKKGLYEIIDYLQNYSKYSAAGVRLPRGVLMYGPPGTGKTLIAKVVHKFNSPFKFAIGSGY
jgi:cell division protease FtsH